MKHYPPRAEFEPHPTNPNIRIRTADGRFETIDFTQQAMQRERDAIKRMEAELEQTTQVTVDDEALALFSQHREDALAYMFTGIPAVKLFDDKLMTEVSAHIAKAFGGGVADGEAVSNVVETASTRFKFIAEKFDEWLAHHESWERLDWLHDPYRRNEPQ